MKQAFYVNPDVLMQKWGSRYDFLVALGILTLASTAILVDYILANTETSLMLRMGVALGYAGLLGGIFAHLARQTSRTDEFGQNILNQSIAKAGLVTLFFVCGIALYFLIINSGDIAAIALFSPALLLALIWKRMRFLAKSYQSTK